MEYIIIRKNLVYYIKHMPTGRLYNPAVVEDLRLLRDIINENINESVKEYQQREQSIREILNCPREV